ncbi:hypothetical protein [Tolypothrix sp. FACHB-123]|nr:hypothetical protein [Tolypothrix sp. FACHB-123]
MRQCSFGEPLRYKASRVVKQSGLGGFPQEELPHMVSRLERTGVR